MPMYLWRNKQTGEEREVFCKIKEVDDFLATVDDSEDWERVILQPHLRTDKLSASWPDGHVPASRRELVRKELEAIKIEQESYRKKPKDRGEYQKELKKLRS